MLLSQLKTQTQQGIQEIQDQIDLLLEQQRELQSYYQQLGSVESAMESAVEQVQQAIALVRNVCPDEIESFRTTVNSQFVGSAIAELPQADSNDSDPVEPDSNDGDDGGTDDDAIAVEPVEADADSVQNDSPVEVAELRPQSGGAAALNFDDMTIAELKQQCRDRDIDTDTVRTYGALSRKATWRKALEDSIQ